MPSPVEQNLHSLLPTVSFLPPELIALSNSLLAQSRTKAASLKPEEEIGRTYACCHIACERLGRKLALEVAKPTPPVKPKVYSKLHTYLSSVLRTAAAPRTPKATRTEDKVQHEASEKTLRSGGSAKEHPVKDTIAPASSLKRTAGSTSEVPSFVMPMIRHICKDLEAPECAIHVFTGVQSILRLQHRDESPTKKRRTSGRTNSSERVETPLLPALVVTIFVAVSKKLYGPSTSGDPQYLVNTCESAQKYCKDNESRLEFAFGQDTNLAADVERFTDKSLDSWMDMEWYHNVPRQQDHGEADGLDASDDEISDSVEQPSKTPLRRKEKHANGTDVHSDVGAAGLLPGLGTMFQPAIDWLSDERRAEYMQWRELLDREIAMVRQKA